jgi:hypothetical protein
MPRRSLGLPNSFPAEFLPASRDRFECRRRPVRVPNARAGRKSKRRSSVRRPRGRSLRDPHCWSLTPRKRGVFRFPGAVGIVFDFPRLCRRRRGSARSLSPGIGYHFVFARENVACALQRTDAPHAIALLRPCHHRPRRCGADKRYKIAPPHHSITSSARANSVGGTVRPSVFAVLRLIVSLNLVGCSIGRLAGFSPLRIRAT